MNISKKTYSIRIKEWGKHGKVLKLMSDTNNVDYMTEKVRTFLNSLSQGE